jgi:hypothetical protein
MENKEESIKTNIMGSIKNIPQNVRESSFLLIIARIKIKMIKTEIRITENRSE